MKLIFTLNGRTGNHFFIISAMNYVIQKYNVNCFLYIPEYVRYQNIQHILNNFNILYEEPKNSIIINGVENIDLDDIVSKYKNSNNSLYFNYSFFQVNNYATQYINRIRNIFMKESEYTKQMKSKINENFTILFIRRTDYFDAKYYVINYKYYIDMYNTYFKGTNIYITSDDIDWCKSNFNINDFEKCENIEYIKQDDILEIYTVSIYFKNYICGNSSFHAMCELSSIHNDKNVIAVKNINSNEYRNHMYNDNAKLIDLKLPQYKKYIYSY